MRKKRLEMRGYSKQISAQLGLKREINRSLQNLEPS